MGGTLREGPWGWNVARAPLPSNASTQGHPFRVGSEPLSTSQAMYPGAASGLNDHSPLMCTEVPDGPAAALRAGNVVKEPSKKNNNQVRQETASRRTTPETRAWMTGTTVVLKLT